MKSLLIVLWFVIIGCKNPLSSQHLTNDYDNPKLKVYMDYDNDGSVIEQDKNGFYHLDYLRGKETWYSRVHMKGEPYTRVYWSSPDSFRFTHMWRDYSNCIISNSTMISNNGIGTQLFLTHPAQEGDTLLIIGTLEDETFDYIQVIIH